MADPIIHEYSDYSAFVAGWPTEEPDETMQSRWQLLCLLAANEVIVLVPEWLAAEKVGYVDGATPTEFIGRIERETEKAIRLGDAAAARPLMRLAHRIANLQEGPETADPDSRAFLERRLRELHRDFENRDQYTGLRDEWLPKSQIRHIARQIEP